MVRKILSFIALVVWPVAFSLLALSHAMAQGEAVASGDVPGIHLTPAAMGVIAGIIVVVGPAFWWAGRYDNRLTSVEKGHDRIVAHIDAVATRNVAAGERIASALELMAEKNGEAR